MRWDIVEEHLESAAFLWFHRGVRLRSPRARFADLRGLEVRLFAHLEGLRRAGAAAQRLLEPALAGDDAEQAAAATLALAREPADLAVQKALAAAGTAPDEVAGAIFEALKVAPGDGLDQALLVALRTAPRALHGPLLSVLSARRVHPGPLESLVAGPFLRSAPAAVLSFGTRVPLPIPREAISDALRSSSVAERDAGLELGMTLGMPEAFSRCAEVIAGGQAAPGHPLLLLALAGGPDGAEVVRRALRDPATAAEALWAAGFSRNAGLVEPCLELAREPALARLAGEAFSALTGQAIDGPLEATRPEGEEPIPDDLSEAELPDPDPQAMETCWRKCRKQGTAPKPPVSFAGRLAELDAAPLRRRHALALGLRLVSGGRLQLSSTAPWSVQSAELESLGREAASGRAPAEPRRSPRGVIEPLPALRTAASRATAPARPAGPALRVLAAAMVSAIGDTAEESAAAAMAGIRRSAEMDGTATAGPVGDVEDTGVQPAVGHQVPSAVGFEGRGRLLQLGSAALAELAPILRGNPHRRTGFLVALPTEYYLEQQMELDGVRLPPRERGEELLGELLKLVDLGPMERVQAYQETAVDFVRALADALDALRHREFERCVVGAIDSLVNPAVVEALDDLLLLKNDAQPARMMPGEAAAFLAVDLEVRGRENAEALAWLSGFHAVTGPGHRKSGLPPNGKLLADCIQWTLAHSGPPSMLASHLNGDDRRAMEWGNAQVRLRASTGLDGLPDLLPAASFGELGAAMGPASVILAALGAPAEDRAGGRCLVWLSGDDGSCASLVVD